VALHQIVFVLSDSPITTGQGRSPPSPLLANLLRVHWTLVFVTDWYCVSSQIQLDVTDNAERERELWSLLLYLCTEYCIIIIIIIIFCYYYYRCRRRHWLNYYYYTCVYNVCTFSNEARNRRCGPIYVILVMCCIKCFKIVEQFLLSKSVSQTN